MVRKNLKFTSADTVTALLMGAALFVTVYDVYLVAYYRRLGVWPVTVETLLFTVLAAGAAWAILRRKLRLTLSLRRPLVYCTAAVVATVLWIVTAAPLDAKTSAYYPRFPLLRLEVGGPVRPDTLFNESLIQSIMNFGYPSTGLNGVPLTPYHVLSHYFEAGVLKVAGLEPLDSAGLVFRLTIMCVAVAMLALIAKSLGEKSPWINLVAVAVALPLAFSGWNAVWSLPLWLTTVLLMVFVSLFFDWFLEGKFTWKRIAALMVFTAVLELGKVSTGIIFFAFIGLMLLIQNWRAVTTWTFLGVTALFSGGYALFIASDRGTAVNLHKVGFLEAFLAYWAHPSSSKYAIFALILLAGLSWWLFGSAVARATFITLAIVEVGALAFAIVNQDHNDVYFFNQALNAVGVLFLIQLIGSFSSVDLKRPRVFVPGKRFWVMAAFVVITVASTYGMEKTFLNIFHPSPKLILGALVSPFERPSGGQAISSLDAFRDSLGEYMNHEHLTRKDSELLIPQEIFGENSVRYATPYWAQGFLAYATTGVPLSHGVTVLMPSYGFSRYTTASLALSREQIARGEACTSAKTQIEVVSWQPAQFRVACR